HIERGDSNISIQKVNQTGSPFFTNNLEKHPAIITSPTSKEAKIFNGSYGGFQPKPAVEVILVVMKPLSEKTYVDQALKNGKGITWLDNGRIPYKGKNDFVISHHNKHLEKKNKSTGIFGATNGYGLLESDISQGRFPANLLVGDDVLNDGKISRSGKNRKSNQLQKNQWLKKSIYYDSLNYGDSGSFSRYFNLDKWWRERSKKLSKQPCFFFIFIRLAKVSSNATS
ncbi:unnamed protein product, partial [marine sediment metagenome]